MELVADNIVNLQIEKALRNNDNTQWRAQDVLEDCAKDIAEGRIQPDSLLLIYRWTEADNTLDKTGYTVANINQFEAIGMMEKVKMMMLGVM